MRESGRKREEEVYIRKALEIEAEMLGEDHVQVCFHPLLSTKIRPKDVEREKKTILRVTILSSSGILRKHFLSLIDQPADRGNE